MANPVKNVTTAATTSWRTTVLGIIAGLTIILPQLQALFDNDPETLFSYETIVAGLALMGIGTVARDSIVSSERAGAAAKLLMVGVLVVFAAGCRYSQSDYAFLGASKRYHDAVGDPFIRYVEEDTSLDAAQKEGRIRAHQLYGDLLIQREQEMTGTLLPPSN